METIRLNKYLAQHGVASRRKADELIKAGDVQVNGKLAGLGDRVSDGDEVLVNGKPVREDKPEPIYIAFHKPVGVISTDSKVSEDTVFDYLGIEDRLFYVGRLDVSSSGLMLFTNDGDFAKELTNSARGHEKEYIVEVNKKLTQDALAQFESGISIMGRKTKAAKTKKVGSKTFHLIISEGRNRQIRRMAEKLGYEVKSLKRIRIENVHLGKLHEGAWRHLRPKERDQLLAKVKS